MKIVKITVDETGCEYDLLIGQSQSENDIILKTSEQNDTWFHLDKFSGPHFVLRNGGDTIPKRYLNTIAGLFSQFKTGLPNRYTVIYTHLKNVRLTKTPGLVIPSNTQTIRV